MYALLLSAKAQSKSVGVVGTGACLVRGNRETVNYMWMD